MYRDVYIEYVDQVVSSPTSWSSTHERCTDVIQTARVVHHMSIEHRGDLVRLSIAHCPHHPNDGTKSNKLHRRCEMNHLFITNNRMTSGQVRKLGLLQIALDDAVDCEVSVVESECRFEWFFPLRKTMTGKVYPLILAQLFCDPGSA